MNRKKPNRTRYIQSVTDKNFKNAVLESRKPVLVAFETDWYGDWHIVEPVFKELAVCYHHHIKFGIYDSDLNSQITQQYRIPKNLFLLFFVQGHVTRRIQGAISKQDLEYELNILINCLDS